MGKSKTIKDQEDLNSEFQGYLASLQADMSKKVETELERFNKSLNEFYGDGPRNVMEEGEKWDYRQKSEFNLDSIVAAINSIIDVAFAEGSPEASSVTANAEYRANAAALGKNVVLNALQVFTVSQVIEFSHSYVAQTVAPGLTLHMLIATDSYSNQKWFNNENIIENYITYKLIYSEEKAKAEQKLVLYDKQIKLLTTYLNSLQEMEDAFMKKLIAGKVASQELEMHSNIVVYMRTSITSCIVQLGGTTPVRANKHIDADTRGAVQKVLVSSEYTDTSKSAFKKMLGMEE